MTDSRPRNFEDILSKLPDARQSGGHWTAPCPLPGHKTPAGHLSLRDAGNKALVTCQGERHNYRDICQWLGFDSLTYSRNGTRPETNEQKTLVATFSYEYEKGKEAYQVRRFDLGNGNKTFKVWLKKDGQYVSGMGEYKNKPILYHLPEIPEWIAIGKHIYLPEGELKADRIISKGGAATTSPFGAGCNKWRPEYNKALAGAEVIVLPDNDKPGSDFAQDKASSLYGIAKSDKVLELPGLPEKGDIVDWFNAGGTFEQLERLASSAPEWKPSSGAARTPGFLLTPLGDLLAEPEEVTPWLWDSTLPVGGLSLLASKPKIGKSTLARNLALAVAKGQPFLGRGTTQGPVVYLALEEKRAEVAAHFTRMGAAEEPVHIHVGVAPEKALEALGQAIRETGAVLAIVDPLLKLVRLRDANDYAEVVRALDPLLQLARDTGCHILAVHHLGKLDREGGDAILGTTALFGAVDTALIMRRRDDARTLESIQRYGENIPKTALAFDRESGTLKAAGTVEELDKQRIGATILETLSDAEMMEKEIYEGVGGNTGQVAKALRRLLGEGKVTRQGGGRKGDPFRYRKIPLSPSPPIEKGEKGAKGETEPAPVASGGWEEEL